MGSARLPNGRARLLPSQDGAARARFPRLARRLALPVFGLAILAGLCVFHTASAFAMDPFGSRFVDRVYTDAAGSPHHYALYVPADYGGNRAWPLIVFLHGIGECGRDGLKPTMVGLGPVVRKRQANFPFLVLFPQSEEESWEAGSADALRALAILDEIERDFRIDRQRVYLTGVSLGGHGVWSLATQDPRRWAAIVPVCGWGDRAQAARLKDIPCWCFHGAMDLTVPAEASRLMVAALRDAGGSPRYTEYPGVGHNSWDRAYATPELYDWLLAQRGR